MSCIKACKLTYRLRFAISIEVGKGEEVEGGKGEEEEIEE